MMVNFDVDESALNRIGKEAVDAFNAKMQPVIDGVYADAHGGSVDEIKIMLATRWQAAADHPLGDPALTEIATAISNGQHVTLQNAG